MSGIMLITQDKGDTMKTHLIILTAMFLSACTGIKGAGESKLVDNTNFYQHWVHSYEEQNGSKTPKIFRPAGSRQFPASRFRMEFGFDKSGQCNYKYLSPDDRHEMRNCIYTKIANKVYLYDEAGALLSHLSFTLLDSAGKDLMRMTYGIKSAIKSNKPSKKNGKPK